MYTRSHSRQTLALLGVLDFMFQQPALALAASDGGGNDRAAPARSVTQPNGPADPPIDTSDVDAAFGTAAPSHTGAQSATASPSVAGPVTAAAGRGSSVMNPDLALIADVALAHFSDEPVQSGGHDPARNGFNLQQLELAFGSFVDPYFRLDANLVFALDGVEIEEVYATTLDLPLGLQLRAGQFLTRFGRANPTHLHAWDFVDQPLALGRVFGGEGQRGLGAELSWVSPLPWYVELVASATNTAEEGAARSFAGESSEKVDGLEDFIYTTALKQFFDLSEDVSLAWGLSAAFGPGATGSDVDSAIYGTDAYLKYRPITRASTSYFSLQTEWFYRRRQVLGSTLSDVSSYAQAVWRFARRWSTAFRYEYSSPSYDAAGVSSHADTLDEPWAFQRHRLSDNLTYYPSEFSRLRLQGSRDLVSSDRPPVTSLFLALEFVTGAHGAHTF